MKSRVRVSSVAKHALLIVLCVVSVFPVWFILQTSLKTNQQYILDPLGFPSHATLENFKQQLASLPVPRWSWNSTIVTLSSAAGSTGIALLASYAFVFGRF